MAWTRCAEVSYREALSLEYHFLGLFRVDLINALLGENGSTRNKALSCDYHVIKKLTANFRLAVLLSDDASDTLKTYLAKLLPL